MNWIPVADPDNPHRFHPQIRALSRRRASGVYLIRAANGDRRVLYVGESHTGRLYGTLTRHFQRWDTPNDRQGRREGGVEYDRNGCQVRFEIMLAGTVSDRQAELIARHDPRDNTNEHPGDEIPV